MLTPQPALPREIAFYQLVAESPRSAPIRQLKPFVPRFYGTLRLEGQLDAASGQIKDKDGKADVPEVRVGMVRACGGGIRGDQRGSEGIKGFYQRSRCRRRGCRRWMDAWRWDPCWNRWTAL